MPPFESIRGGAGVGGPPSPETLLLTGALRVNQLAHHVYCRSQSETLYAGSVTMRGTTPWLRIESLTVFAVVLVAYEAVGGSWPFFLVLLLLPDLGMLGYLAGPRIGGASYNLTHLYAWPALLFGAWIGTGAEWALAGGLIWAAHIALDRALGYGLKEADSFRHTHLGRIGGRAGADRDEAAAPAGAAKA